MDTAFMLGWTSLGQGQAEVHLIRSLIKEPNKQLVDLTFDNVKDAKDDAHPTLRQRILFLEKNCSPFSE